MRLYQGKGGGWGVQDEDCISECRSELASIHVGVLGGEGGGVKMFTYLMNQCRLCDTPPCVFVSKALQAILMFTYLMNQYKLCDTSPRVFVRKVLQAILMFTYLMNQCKLYDTPPRVFVRKALRTILVYIPDEPV